VGQTGCGSGWWTPGLLLKPVSCLVVSAASCQCHYQTIPSQLGKAGGKRSGVASPTWLAAKMSLAPSLESQTMRATTSFPTVSLRVPAVTCPPVGVVESCQAKLSNWKNSHFNTIICRLKRKENEAAQDGSKNGQDICKKGEEIWWRTEVWHIMFFVTIYLYYNPKIVFGHTDLLLSR